MSQLASEPAINHGSLRFASRTNATIYKPTESGLTIFLYPQTLITFTTVHKFIDGLVLSAFLALLPLKTPPCPARKFLFWEAVWLLDPAWSTLFVTRGMKSLLVSRASCVAISVHTHLTQCKHAVPWQLLKASHLVFLVQDPSSSMCHHRRTSMSR